MTFLGFKCHNTLQTEFIAFVQLNRLQIITMAVVKTRGSANKLSEASTRIPPLQLPLYLRLIKMFKKQRMGGIQLENYLEKV